MEAVMCFMFQEEKNFSDHDENDDNNEVMMMVILIMMSGTDKASLKNK